MRDIDRLLSDSLRSVGHAYRPTDLYGAQTEFHVRRRRRRTLRVSGAVALAGAAAVAAIVVAQTQPFADDTPAPTGRGMVVATTINVGADPTGVTFGGDELWTANSGDGTVARIDPETSLLVDIYDVGGAPDDVAVAADIGGETGLVVVANPDLGGVQRINPDTENFSNAFIGNDLLSGHIDVAADDFGAVWAVAGETGLLVKIDQYDGGIDAIDDDSWSDVAVGDGRAVWLLDEPTGNVSRYDPEQTQTVEVAELNQSGVDDDLAFGEGYVWVVNGDEGTVVRVDPITGEVSDKLEVGGDYAAVTTGEGAVWVLAGSDSGVGDLWQIDPDTIQVQGRLTLTGRPADVVVADGSLWVTNKDAGTLTRIDLVER